MNLRLRKLCLQLVHFQMDRVVALSHDTNGDGTCLLKNDFGAPISNEHSQL